jgi:hypothetical protein
MNKFTKTMIAAALFAGAGAANAALLTGSQSGTNELFLTVYNDTAVNSDATLGLTYNLDLNITFNQVKANAGAAFASIGSVINNLTTDANWNTFLGKITPTSQVKFIVAGGDQTNHGAVITGKTKLQPLASGQLVDSMAFRINEHAVEINGSGIPGAGLVGQNSNSSVVKDVPATPFVGQFSHAQDGLPAQTVWAGWGHNPISDYGTDTGLWLAGFHQETIIDEFGDEVTFNTFTAQDVTDLGTLRLAGSSLTYAAPVPLPAAVWLFGAGLMGLLRATRRKSVEV